MNQVNVNKEMCMGCRICEIICSSAHQNGYNPKVSRIRVPITYPMPSPPIVCRQCANPKCVEACPTGALAKGQWVKYSEDECNGCQSCIEACPFKAIWPSPEGKILKCDTCNGEYNCVSACPGQALSTAGGDKS